MKSIVMALCLAVWIFPVEAQSEDAKNKPTVNVDLQARASFYNDRVGGEVRHDDSGFKGDYLNLIVSGKINDKFSYSWRQRLNKKISNSDFFDATDWIYVDYKVDRHWSAAAGKQIVMIGGYEYERAPIDVYTASEYWNHISCYQFGASVTYTANGGKDKLSAQFCESPFWTEGRHDQFAYNLYWTGVHGLWSTMYSLNMIEYAPERYISYLSLGNRFAVGNAALELDFMNRAASHQTFLFSDCSIIANVDWRLLPKLNLYGKVAYDVNKANTGADRCVVSGTELTTYAAGMEFFPIKGKGDVRLNAGIAYTCGSNTNPDGVMLHDRLTLQIGLTAKLHLLKL